MKRIKALFHLKDQRGVTALIVAILIFVLIGFIALGIDLGYMYSSRNELQNAADAAALAATGKLGNIYEGMPYDQQQEYICDGAEATMIKDVAKEIALKNKAATKQIEIRYEDIIIGQWTPGTPGTLTPTPNQPDAVEVTARRDGTENGPISTFFARVLGIDTVDVSADATAALTGLGEVGEGGLPIPLGISKTRFESDEWCDKPIKLQPSNDLEACGGWHTYDDPDGKIKVELLPGLIDGSIKSPETEAYGEDLFYFTGGTVDPAFVLLRDLYEANKALDDDMDPETWTTTVVVYDSDDCSNPNTSLPIIGFAMIRIYGVCSATSDPSIPITGGPPNGPPPGPPQTHCVLGEKQIVAIITCDYIEAGRGGGGEYGLKGSIPGLVE